MLPEIALLRQVRIERNLTYVELAKALDVSAGVIHRWFADQHEPSERTLYRIRVFLQQHQESRRLA
jgi:transcriptional regulator with XRE-family HTH domain